MHFDLNWLINQQFTNMFVSFTVTTNTAIITIIIALTFTVNVTDQEIFTAVHFITNSSNSETFLHNFWRNWASCCKDPFTDCWQWRTLHSTARCQFMLRGCHPLVVKLPESNLEWLINDNIQRLQNLVIPPGIRGRSESSLTSASTLSVTHPWKLSKTNMVCLHNKAPGCLFHTTFNHSRISFSVIHHLYWNLYNNSWQKFFFWDNFWITNGGNLWLSAVTANVTLHHCLSTFVILTWTICHYTH